MLRGCAGTSVPAVLAAEREVPVVLANGHFHVLLPIEAPSEAQGLFHEALAGLFITELKEFLRRGDQSCQVCFANNFLPDCDLSI